LYRHFLEISVNSLQPVNCEGPSRLTAIALPKPNIKTALYNKWAFDLSALAAFKVNFFHLIQNLGTNRDNSFNFHQPV
jgi:hypothetical protein